MSEARDICLRLLKGKQQKWVRQLKSLGLGTVMIVSHNYFSEWSCTHFFWQPFSKQLYVETNWTPSTSELVLIRTILPVKQLLKKTGDKIFPWNEDPSQILQPQTEDNTNSSHPSRSAGSTVSSNLNVSVALANIVADTGGLEHSDNWLDSWRSIGFYHPSSITLLMWQAWGANGRVHKYSVAPLACYITCQ